MEQCCHYFITHIFIVCRSLQWGVFICKVERGVKDVSSNKVSNGLVTGLITTVHGFVAEIAEHLCNGLIG